MSEQTNATLQQDFSPVIDASSMRSQILWQFLHSQVDARANQEGRTDSHLTGLRFYRFSSLIEYRKTQRHVPGFIVVVQGQKTAKINSKTYRYGAGQSLVLAREVICTGTVVQADAQTPYLAIHLDLPPAMLVKTMIALAAQIDSTPASDAQDAGVLEVETHVLEALCRLLPTTDSETDRLTLAPLILEEIIVRLMRSDLTRVIRSSFAISRTSLKIQESMQYIQAQFREVISVESLAQRVAMSPSHYAHSFREVCGMSPMRYLRDIRLNEACGLLMSQSLRISEVAMWCGFVSDAHFSREFKRRFECSPAQYALRLRSNSPHAV
jgi:AraC-like DNA-binding protein